MLKPLDPKPELLNMPPPKAGVEEAPKALLPPPKGAAGVALPKG